MMDENRKYRITVVGAGYVGLSIAALLTRNNKVTLFDIDATRIDTINSGILPINDCLIGEMLSDDSHSLIATRSKKEAYENADYVIIAVPTDYSNINCGFDTSIVDSVIENILEFNKRALIIIKSTVPVGYTDNAVERYNTKNIVFCPEFLRESKGLYDCQNPSRIIISCTKETKKSVREFCRILTESTEKEIIKVYFMGAKEAESVKLFSNTYLAMRVSFFNEVDTFAENKGMNARTVIEGICADPRIGDYYNNPSFGYGGYCLPKDSKQLLSHYSDIPEKMISAIVESNEIRKQYIANKILQIFKNRVVSEQRYGLVGIYRLSMKSESDNSRNAAIIDIIEILRGFSLQILIYEPFINKLPGNYDFEFTDDITKLKRDSLLIIANRYNACLDDVKEKVYTRDVFYRD